MTRDLSISKILATALIWFLKNLQTTVYFYIKADTQYIN